MSAAGRRNGLQGRYCPDWSDLMNYLIHPSDWSTICHSKPYLYLQAMERVSSASYVYCSRRELEIMHHIG